MSRSAEVHFAAQMAAEEARAAGAGIAGYAHDAVVPGTLPMSANGDFNLNNMLAHNIRVNDYFAALDDIVNELEIIDEIYNTVTCVEPWAPGTARMPSSAFCLLYKLFLMRLTAKQMHTFLKHKDSPYIRCVGFLYLRFTLPAKLLWEWYEPYLDDPEEFSPGGDGVKTTMGQYVRDLLTEQKYFATILPRIPVPIMRQMQIQLLEHEQASERRKENLARISEIKPGFELRAQFTEDNQWYDARVDDYGDQEGSFWVTYLPEDEYGNSEQLDLRRLELPEKRDRDRDRRRDRDRDRDRGSSRRSRDRDRDRDRDRRRRSRSRSRDRDRDRDRDRRYSSSSSSRSGGGQRSKQDLMAEVLARERKKAEASGTDYAHRPSGLKSSLSVKLDRFTSRKRSRSRSPVRQTVSHGGSYHSRGDHRRERRDRSESPPPKRKAAPTAESLARMKMLKERYGDASARK